MIKLHANDGVVLNFKGVYHIPFIKKIVLVQNTERYNEGVHQKKLLQKRSC